MEYNIYCDESCHLEHDKQKSMVLGALKCSKEKRLAIAQKIRKLKEKHGLSPYMEIKWVKVSRGKSAFYEELVDLFFDEPELAFRGVVIPDKSVLQHELHQNTHDDFYYRIYFLLLNVFLENGNRYNVYLDIKDTRGQQKVHKLHEVLANANYDFDRQMIQKIQQVHSHDIEQMQLADLFIGALGYLYRGLEGNEAKLAVLRRIKERSGLSLDQSTLPTAKKFNLLVWKPRWQI